MLRGATHVHSTYSDGEFTLTQLRELFLKDGCHFLCMSDHAEKFNKKKLCTYISECNALSDDRFRFIAGLEYECQERMHILGFGSTREIQSTDPQEVIRSIAGMGGLSVIAHPVDIFFPWIETFAVLPVGIEVWNLKFDGRYAPRPQTFNFTTRLQLRQPDIKAFYGIDLHWKQQYRGLYIEVDVQDNKTNNILAALTAGNFKGIKNNINLPSNARLPEPMRAEFETAHAVSARFRNLVSITKKIIRDRGITIPNSVKARLRSFF